MKKEIIIPYKSYIPDEPKRPLVDIQIENVGIMVCILDSGADYSTFPLNIAHQAGLNLSNAKEGRSECVHGHSCNSYTISLDIIFYGKKMTIPANFVEEGKEPALIGRKGFFDKFEVTFDESKEEIRLKY